MKIGIVDLDTSHPPNWIPILKELGHDIVGVCDHGDVHPPGYAAQFVADHDAGRLFDSLGQMVDRVDAAIIHSCDWDQHVPRARPFIEAGKAVLIDKPLAGNVRDLRQFQEWAAGGACVTGGSSLRFCFEAQEYLARPEAERGTPHTVLAGCAVDEFNYGIHAYALLAGLMGAEAASVRHLGAGTQRRVQINWADGRVGFVLVGPLKNWVPFYATTVSESGVTQFIVDNDRIYRALLEAVLPYLAGQIEQPPVPMDQLVAPELWALAARQSWRQDDREVALDELTEADPGYDGAAFAASYRQQKYPEVTG